MTRGPIVGDGKRGLRRAKDSFSWDTFVWIGIAALAAYVLGGSDPVEPSVESSESEPDAPPTEEAAEGEAPADSPATDEKDA